ncbi:hypothetical protein [Enterococcus sp. AZ109]|uniref:hypothetical protein n=1 Tax=Enterococcus sp. AZ109 TaxID=2774634 RepID=UPI003F24F00B
MSDKKKTITERKSNKSVKTAVLLFGAVLLTTSLLGGTLAKYVGEIGTATDTARVARWGITPQEQTLDLFDTAYDQIPGKQNTVENITDPSDNQNLFAPGTTKSVIAEPVMDEDELNAVETAFRLRYAPNANGVFGTYVGNWKRSNDSGEQVDWLPLRFSVYSYNEAEQGADKYTTPVYDGINAMGKDALTPGGVNGGDVQRNRLNEVLEAIESSEVIYPSDTLEVKKEKLKRMSVKIVWEWPFERPELSPNDDELAGTIAMVDGWDTVLGNRAASLGSTDPSMPRFELTMKYTAVQVD